MVLVSVGYRNALSCNVFGDDCALGFGESRSSTLAFCIFEAVAENFLGRDSVQRAGWKARGGRRPVTGCHGWFVKDVVE